MSSTTVVCPKNATVPKDPSGKPLALTKCVDPAGGPTSNCKVPFRHSCIRTHVHQHVVHSVISWQFIPNHTLPTTSNPHISSYPFVHSFFSYRQINSFLSSIHSCISHLLTPPVRHHVTPNAFYIYMNNTMLYSHVRPKHVRQLFMPTIPANNYAHRSPLISSASDTTRWVAW